MKDCIKRMLRNSSLFFMLNMSCLDTVFCSQEAVFMLNYSKQNLDLDDLYFFTTCLCLSCDTCLSQEYIQMIKTLGLKKTLHSFFSSPSYQLFKLCQNNEIPPALVSQKANELLHQGAKPDFTLNTVSLIRIASINGQEEIVNLLLQNGARPVSTDIDAISLKLSILETCQNDVMHDDYQTPQSLAFDKERLLRIKEMLQNRISASS